MSLLLLTTKSHQFCTVDKLIVVSSFSVVFLIHFQDFLQALLMVSLNENGFLISTSPKGWDSSLGSYMMPSGVAASQLFLSEMNKPHT